MQQTDGPSSSVSFPTHDPSSARTASPTSDTRGSPTAPPKLGSRSTSFAIMESPHRSAVPSPLGPGGGSAQRRRVVTQTPTMSRKGKEREPGNYAGEIFAGYGVSGVGEDMFLGPDDSGVVEDVQRLLNRRDNRQRAKESLTSSPTTATDTPAASPPPPALRQTRPTPTKSQTSPTHVTRSAPTTPSKPRQAQTSVSSQGPSTSTEVLVIYENPTASSSKTTLDWSGYTPHEQQPAQHKRKFSLTRMRKPSKTEMQTSDTGEDADTFEASLKAIRDRTSENTWSRVAGAKQELSARYSTFFRFLNEFKRAFNPADVLRWKARHSVTSTNNMGGLIPTASLPSFALSASDPNLRLFLDDGRNMRFKLTSSTVNEWFEAEVKPPPASEVLNTAPSSPKIGARIPPNPRSRGASLSIQQGATDGPSSPAESGRRVTRLSHPGTSLDSLKGPLNAMLSAARKERDGGEHSGASLAKLSAKAMRAFRRDHSPIRSHPTSAANSDDESGASQRNKVSISISRPQTPEIRSVGGVESITDDDGRSGRSLGHLAKKSWHNLLSMTSMGDRDRMSDLSPMQLSPVLSPVGSTDAVSKTLDDIRSPRSPYLEPNWNSKRAAVTSKSSEEYDNSPHVRKMYQQRARELDDIRRESETTKRFLRSVADTLREYARLQKDFADLLGTDGSAIDEQVLAAVDLDPFYIPRAQRKTLAGTSWRAADDVAARIQAQSKAFDNCIAQCDRGLLKAPGPELGDNLAGLLAALHDLEAEREEISRTADELAELEPKVERLNAEFEWEVSDVERVIAQSYGIKTSATVMTSQWESSMARFMEFCLTRGATAYRYTTTRKRVWLTIVLLSMIYIIIDSGWGRWVVLYIYTALITTGLGLAFAFAIVVIVTFVAKGGYSNASSFAS